MTKKVVEKEITITELPIKKVTFTLVGDTDLILCKKARSFERQEIFKQSHPKGTKIPAEYQQPYSLWERLITSIHWLNPIEFHDDNHELYTEEEWKHYMETNKPCIIGKAFKDSMKEAFISCGFKESTGKNGTDYMRTTRISEINPISFVQAGYDQHLAMTSGLSRVNVLTQQNVFNGWTCDITITFLESAIPLSTITELLTAAGTFIGIGSRRGEGYGRYHISSIRNGD